MSLKPAVIQSLSIAYNTAVRRCFHISRYTSVRNVLYFLNSMPVNIILEERRVLLFKSCLESDSDVIRLCALLSANDDNFIHICYKYDVHCNLSRLNIKSAVVNTFFNGLRNEGLV